MKGYMVPSEPTVQNVQNGQIFSLKRKFMKKGGCCFFLEKSPHGGTSGQKKTVRFVRFVRVTFHTQNPTVRTYETLYGQKVPSGFVRFCQPPPPYSTSSHPRPYGRDPRAGACASRCLARGSARPRRTTRGGSTGASLTSEGSSRSGRHFTCFSCSSGYGCSSTAPGDEHTAGSYANRAVALQTPEEKLREWVEEGYTHVPLRDKDTGTKLMVPHTWPRTLPCTASCSEKATFGQEC